VSYSLSFSSLFGLGAITCPPGWELQPDGSTCWAPPGSTCPPGFMGQATTEGEPGTCVPTEPGACKTIGSVFDPLFPSQCKKQCSPGTVVNELGICMPLVEAPPPPVPIPAPPPQPAPPPASKSGASVAPQSALEKSAPWIALGALGLGLVAVLASSRKRKS
jgi:hypothetical protein